MLPTVKGSRGEARACCDLPEFVAPDPEAIDSFLHLYEAPGDPQREDAPGDTALPAVIHVPVEIRGPMKTCWTPAWTLEESLGQGTGFALEPTRVCGFCQAIFSSDTAAQEDYLKHVLAHMK
ncbi:TRAF family member-associated NF-kappa-B activator-like [Nothoprocta perdicaria]|uniref:TRAF family member-associated NF-kappa-B activator-like n=1 Tax=Nothoprocta perdicaria TaxID=30464 RepID=UPI000E1B6157|nr:TRAF family member-associated NF-kappa-B activator-like [Nothoprocta perdicaria]